MELIEQEDAQDVFEECNDTEGIFEETKASSSDLNKENVKLFNDATTTEEQIDNFKDANCYPIKTNNHRIVPVGVAIVLMTIFLGISNVPKCLVSCVENTPKTTEDVKQAKENILNYLQKPEIMKNSQILERLLEYKDICKDLAVFTKNIEEINKNEGDQLEGEGEEEQEDYDNDDVNSEKVLKDIEVNKVVSEEGSTNVDLEGSSSSSTSGSGSSAASGNGENCDKSSRHKHKKSKYSIKSANTKNGFNKHNKSTKAKYQKSPKKEINLNKKNSTAEPIIYLFALVFIYLLLKAASDINQHYKSVGFTKNF